MRNPTRAAVTWDEGPARWATLSGSRQALLNVEPWQITAPDLITYCGGLRFKVSLPLPPTSTPNLVLWPHRCCVIPRPCVLKVVQTFLVLVAEGHPASLTGAPRAGLGTTPVVNEPRPARDR